MSVTSGLNRTADTYSKWADDAEVKASLERNQASYQYGRAAAFRQAAIDLRMLADLAADPAESKTSVQAPA